MPIIQARDRQTLLDIAMQESGTAEEAFALAVANGLSVTQDLYNTQQLVSTPVVNALVVNTFKRENRKPATGETLLSDDDEGIDFWAIEEDFIIQ